jgi:hypothetical protein
MIFVPVSYDYISKDSLFDAYIFILLTLLANNLLFYPTTIRLWGGVEFITHNCTTRDTLTEKRRWKCLVDSMPYPPLPLVWRFSTQRNRSSTLKSDSIRPRSASTVIPVMLVICCSSDFLSPSHTWSCEQKTPTLGARRSWSVYPRVNHLLLRKADSHSIWDRPFWVCIETSDR